MGSVLGAVDSEAAVTPISCALGNACGCVGVGPGGLGARGCHLLGGGHPAGLRAGQRVRPCANAPRRARWARRSGAADSEAAATPFNCALDNACGCMRLRRAGPYGLGAQGFRFRGGGQPAQLRAKHCVRLRAAAPRRARLTRCSGLPAPRRRSPAWLRALAMRVAPAARTARLCERPATGAPRSGAPRAAVSCVALSSLCSRVLLAFTSRVLRVSCLLCCARSVAVGGRARH